MDHLRFADIGFLMVVGLVSFVALNTGDLGLVVVMVGLGVYALYQYVWLPNQQKQIRPLVNRAQAARDVGRAEEAVKLYDQAIAKAPKNFDLYFECAQVYVAKKNYGKALYYLKQAARINPNNPGLRMMISSVYCRMGNHQQALTINNDMINANPSSPNAAMGYLGRGTVFVYLRKFDRALADFVQAKLLKPDFFLAHCCVAEGFCYVGEFDKALNAAERSIDLHPSFSTTYVWRGWAKYGLGLYEAALQDCNSAIQQDPTFGRSYEIRGRIHQAMGQLELAEKDLERALELCRQDGLAQFEADVMQPLAAVRQALGKDATVTE